MSAAVFVLAINIFVACIFGLGFVLAAAYARSAIAARWLAASYGVGMLNPVLEFLLPGQVDARPMQVAIAMSFLVAVAMGIVGLARHYRLSPPWRLLGIYLVAAFLLNIAIVDMSRGEPLRHVLYQSPFFVVHVLAVITILRFKRRQALDNALVALFALSAVQFLVKPMLATMMGAGDTAQLYMGSTYAAVSQTLGGMLLIGTGLLLLLIILRDAMAEMTARSQTDTLSSVLNRRGFEERGDRVLALAQRNKTPVSIVVADLDHFKSINDSHGHGAGDRVIAGFADLLVDAAERDAVVGRIGGEEFAVVLAGARLDVARHYAEAVRSRFASLPIMPAGTERRLSASFGVAALEPGDTLSELMRRADAALYAAKKSGRDRVCVASQPEPILPKTGRQDLPA